MPKPGKNESQKDFVARCIPIILDDRTAEDQKQAAAICYSMWREAKKELEMDDKATWSAASVNDLPDSCFLYVEPGDKEDGKTVPRSKRHLPYKNASGEIDLPHLRNAISRLGQSATGSDGWLSESLRKRLLAKAQRLLASHKKTAFDKAMDWLKEALGMGDELEDTDDKEANTFIVWKDGPTYRWLALYSNKFRDEDSPPEILSEAAHKDFVDAVDKGEWAYPELWLWHVKGTVSGRADYVAYDSSGFSLASGTFDADKQPIAKALSEMDDLLTSHGMPAKEIRREDVDPTVITRYRSIEISPLPSWAAANKHGTHFTILKEVDEMALPQNKRPFLEQVMGGKEAVDDLEKQLEGKAKELEDQGVEFKDNMEPAAEVAKDETPAPEAAPEEPKPDYATMDDVAEAFGKYVKPLMDKVEALTGQLEALGKELKELKVAEEEKLKTLVNETPAASLSARIASVIGAPETQIDGRSTLAKQGPQEAAADGRDGPTMVPWLNQQIAKNLGRGG